MFNMTFTSLSLFLVLIGSMRTVVFASTRITPTQIVRNKHFLLLPRGGSRSDMIMPSTPSTTATASTTVRTSTCNRNANELDSIIGTMRGGSQRSQTKDEPSFMLQKVRNLIRSLLNQKNMSPLVTTLVEGICGSLERMTGVKLLPRKKELIDEEEVPKKKRTKKKKSKSATKITEEVKAPPKKKATSSKSKTETKVSSKKPKSLKAPAASAAAANHVAKPMKQTSPNYRIQRELKTFLQSPPPHLRCAVGKNIRVWVVSLTGTPGTIYEHETFKLRITFPPQYPTVPPSVYFIPNGKFGIPKHEHVYTNGDICLSLLGKGWRPQMTAQSIAVSIQSILASARVKELPMDNARHAINKPGLYQEDWVYHDDNC
mmetsp:Transcript_15533/g.18891  ORF Transcript_15533/g.18891 Transcript_15533/m.18891 type:complete len:373 (+) Transcript_15533:310-1428(+)